MKMPDMRVDGKVALITGAGSGIGKAVAEGLANFGADVIITEISPKIEVAQQAAAEISQTYGKRAVALPLNLPDLASIDQMVTEAVNQFGRIDILVNNAGIQIAKPALEVTEADWDAVLDINLKGAFFTAQRVAKEMVKQKWGRVINIASQNGVIGYYKRAAYCSAKAGMVNLTRVLAIEWAEYGINVNAIGPTFIRTPLGEQTFKDQKLYSDIVSRIPLGRIGEPEEIIGAVVYLASEAASLVTGHTLMVDGGWTAM
ncbi:MAG TPA: 3-oxoacyl-ACP reductase family protein [Chloroflexia bacterium]|nr:3-oxoacyl-ACP reductase family protein [Chloroflexia bacterium]